MKMDDKEIKDVSIIMPVYNNILYIAESIESVLSQTYRNWELLIIDDGSEINVKNYIKPYLKDMRIKYYKLKTNCGVATARNVGVKLAKGQYIAFLDSDDIWLSEKLERQIYFMRQYDIALSYTGYRRFKKNKNFCGAIISASNKVSYEDLLKGNCIGCLTVMIDSRKIDEFNMPLIHHEDYAAWLDVTRKGFCFYGINEDLARYRITDTSLSSNKIRSLVWTWKVYRVNQKLSVLKSTACILCYIFYGIIKRL